MQLSVEDYLHSVYEPDAEYVDGELQERNVGEIEHSELVLAIATWFQEHAKEWQIRVLPDVRVQVSSTRFRVPDVALCIRSNQEKHIARQAPLAVIEVVSPEDRISRYNERIADYKAMGIRGIWVVDPEIRQGWDCSTGNWIETSNFQIENSLIAMNLTDILARLSD